MTSTPRRLFGFRSGMRRLYPLDRRRDRRPLVWLLVLVVLLIGVRAASMIVVAQPGYTDAYYFANVAGRLARGQGLSADFIWNYVEAPRFAVLPVPSHRFWMPLPTMVQALGILLGGAPLGDFRAAQVAIVAVAAVVPVAGYAAARAIGARVMWALVAAAVVGLGGVFAPFWVSLDAYGIAALLGTLFFLAFAQAAAGSVRFGVASGILVGLLYLTRAEAALFGLALLWLVGRRRTRRAGILGSLVALAFGYAWVVRNALVGFPDDLLARAVLLVRYEDFFALEPPTIGAFLAAWPDVLVAKGAALVTNAYTAAVLVLLAVPLVPIALAARRRWARPDVRAFVVLAVLVYVIESLVFTPHSVRGSYVHSIAAFFPFAVALAAVGIDELLRASPRQMRIMVAGATLAVFGAWSAFATAEWDLLYNVPYRERLAAVPSLPPGPLIAADAAAWRWITGRTALLAPADGERSAACAAEVYLATTLILEPAHFSRYEDAYTSRRTELFTWRGDRGGVRLYALREGQRCIIAVAGE